MKKSELDLSINADNLTKAWQDQASMMLHWATKAADATKAFDEAKAELSVTDATLDLDIRKNPAKHDLEKVTEATISAAVLLSEKHVDANDDLIEAKHEMNLCKAVVEALQNRKSSLSGMTDLWLRQYYADPTNKEQPEELRAAGTTQKQITRRRKRKRPK